MPIQLGGNAPIVLILTNMPLGTIINARAQLTQGSYTRKWELSDMTIVDTTVTLPMTQEWAFELSPGAATIELKFLIDGNVYFSQVKSIYIAERFDLNIIGTDTKGTEETSAIEIEIVTDTIYEGGSGGTNEHPKLILRNEPNQHTIEAISGLRGELDSKPSTAALEEVRNIAESAVKPDQIPKELPNPEALTFTGAVSASYDGKATVVVNIPEQTGGTNDHNQLINRDAENQHSIISITGLEYRLNEMATSTELEEVETIAINALPKSDLPETLPNPNAITFTGASAGSYDGSEPMTVNIPAGGGGGTSDHADLTHLDYDSSGHTGFATAAQGARADSAVQDEVDPTVSAWAKAATKPTYTAEEVGALPSSTIIPTKTSQLQNDSEFINNTTLESGLENKADLVNGLIPTSQVPSTFDDIVEAPAVSDFPAVGESGKIYLATLTNVSYRWSGTQYVSLNSGLALGETENTAYRGDRGRAAYDHSISTGNPHNTTYSQITGTPTSLPADGGDSDTVGGLAPSAFATAAQGAKADSAVQTESDPTVPSWAKQPTKPSYTAAEVGALATSAAENFAPSGFGLGDNYGTIPNNDCNQIPSGNGFYSSTGTLTNAPPDYSAPYGRIMQMGGGDWTCQIGYFYYSADNPLWYRLKSSGAGWRPWQKFARNIEVVATEPENPQVGDLWIW